MDNASDGARSWMAAPASTGRLVGLIFSLSDVVRRALPSGTLKERRSWCGAGMRAAVRREA